MPRFSSVILCLIYSIFCLHNVLAAPSVTSPALSRRQQNGSPVTVVTVNTVQGQTGPVTETCTVTLTPISVNGQDQFREEKSCVQTPISSNNNNTPSNISGSSSDSSSAAQQSTQTDGGSQATSTSSSSATPTVTSISTSQTADTASSSGPANPTDVQVIGPSSTSALPTDNAATSITASPTGSSSASAAATDGPAVIEPTNVTVLGTSSMPAASASAAAALISSSMAAASASATAAAAFAIPGKQIQVLPIGLGVFAGVSVIALIIVGLVTYERTKYRKKFRKDKLTEDAAPMGYGGMAERR